MGDFWAILRESGGKNVSKEQNMHSSGQVVEMTVINEASVVHRRVPKDRIVGPRVTRFEVRTISSRGES